MVVVVSPSPTPPATRHGTPDEAPTGGTAAGEPAHVSPRDPAERIVRERLNATLVHAYGGRHHVGRLVPVEAILDVMPQSDLAVYRYGPHDPDGPEAILAVQVSGRSGLWDRQSVADAACDAVQEHWRVDVAMRMVEVHTGPRPDGTWSRMRVVDGDARLPLPETDVHIALEEVLAGI